MLIESIEKIKGGNSFRVKGVGDKPFVASAEHAARIIVERYIPFTGDMSAGLCLLLKHIETALASDRGGLTEFELKGVLGVIRGLESLASCIEMDTRLELSVLNAFADSADPGCLC